MSLLSIIIVNWNTRNLLRDCLTSIRENLREPSLEVIVVDNGSVDDSVAMVRTEFPDAKLIENGINLGFAKANNVAIRQAHGRFLLLLNSDTVVRQGAIEGLLSTMEGDPAVGVAGLQLLNGDGSLQNSVGNCPSLLTELTNKSLLRRLFPARFPGKEQLRSKPYEVESIIGACMLARREAVQEVGPLDEDYFFYLEETDWCLRMRKAGWKVAHDPRYSIFHLQGKSAGAANVRARIEYWRSRYTFFGKHRGPGARAVLRVGLLMRLLADFLSMAVANGCTGFCIPRLRNKFNVYFNLLVWHMRGCPRDWGLDKT